MVKKHFISKNIIFVLIFTTLTNAFLLGQSTNCETARAKYLEMYKDVKRAGVDPWLHYNQFGRKEGRTWPICDETISDKKPKIVENKPVDYTSSNYTNNSKNSRFKPNIVPKHLQFFESYDGEKNKFEEEIRNLEKEINSIDSLEKLIDKFGRYSQKNNHAYFGFNKIDTGLANLFLFYENKVIYYLEPNKWGKFQKKLAKLNLRNTNFVDDDYKIYFAYDTVKKSYINLPLLNFEDVLKIEKYQKTETKKKKGIKGLEWSNPQPTLGYFLIRSQNSRFGKWYYSEDEYLLINKKFSVFLKKHPEIFRVVPESSKKGLLSELTNIDDPIRFKKEFINLPKIDRQIKDIKGKMHKLNEETFYYGRQKLHGTGIVKNKHSMKTLWTADWRNGVPYKIISFDFNIPQSEFLLHDDSVKFSVNTNREVSYSISQFKTKREGSSMVFSSHGYGMHEISRLKYIGQYIDGDREGYGTEIQYKIKQYIDGDREGYGTEIQYIKRKTNQIYEGYWRNNRQNGEGKLILQYGTKKEWTYIGEFSDGSFNGMGTISYRDSSRESQGGLFAHGKLIKTNYQLSYERSQREAERIREQLVTSGNYDKQIVEVYQELFSESIASEVFKIRYDFDEKAIEKIKAFEDGVLGRSMSEDEKKYFYQTMKNGADQLNKGLEFIKKTENIKSKAKTKPSKTACQCEWCGRLFPNTYSYLLGDYHCESYCSFEKCELDRKNNRR